MINPYTKQSVNPASQLERRNASVLLELSLLVKAVGDERADRLSMNCQMALGRARRFLKKLGEHG